MKPKDLSELHEKLSDISKARDNQTGLQLVADQLGVNKIAYLGMTLPKLSNEQPHILVTYSEAWVNHYIDADYVKIDPVVTRGTRSLMPLDWRRLRDLHPESEPFFADAASSGVGQNGLTCPIRGPAGESALFSITSNDDSASWRLFRNENLPLINMAAHLVHEMVLRTNDIILEAPRLSPREREVLQWAANGKTQEDIGTILNLSVKTVGAHIEKAKARLGALNTTHATSRALRFGLIAPPD